MLCDPNFLANRSFLLKTRIIIFWNNKIIAHTIHNYEFFGVPKIYETTFSIKDK